MWGAVLKSPSSLADPWQRAAFSLQLVPGLRGLHGAVFLFHPGSLPSGSGLCGAEPTPLTTDTTKGVYMFQVGF